MRAVKRESHVTVWLSRQESQDRETDRYAGGCNKGFQTIA